MGEAYSIKDEHGQYVHGSSIKKIGNNFYYLPYQSLKDGCIVYTSKIRVEKALSKLELHNEVGKLGHNFMIVQI